MEPLKIAQAMPLVNVAEPTIDDLLKHSIRTQLQSLTQTKLTRAEQRLKLQHSFTQAMEAVLTESAVSHQVLDKLFTQMYDQAVLTMSKVELSQELLTRQYISATGLIMSPLNCRTTIKDIYRIKGFARGIDKAIKKLLEQQSSLHILYPACGPFAPLLLPLLQYYKQHELYTSEQIQLTLVDLQPGAVLSLQQLIADLDIGDFIAEVVEADATLYRPEGEVDILVIEAMQHGFSKEGQLSMARHLSQFLSLQGYLLPQNISVRGIMVDGETEFNLQWKTAEFAHSQHLNPDIQSQRVELGELLSINKSSLLQMKEFVLEEGIQVIEGNTVEIPTGVFDMASRILAIYAHIEVFSGETVEQYDSGITHPLPDMNFYIDAKPRAPEPRHFVANSGDRVRFYYQLTGLPGFIPVKVEGAGH